MITDMQHTWRPVACRFQANNILRLGLFRFLRLVVAGDGAKWTPAQPGGWARAGFQAVGSVKVRQHRAVPGTVKFLQLKREYRRWYVIVITGTEPSLLPTGGRVGGRRGRGL